LTSLIEGHGAVGAGDVWSPHGNRAPAPIRLDEATGFIKNPEHKAALREWWVSEEPLLNRALAQRQTAGRQSKAVRLPAFDLVATCQCGVDIPVCAESQSGVDIPVCANEKEQSADKNVYATLPGLLLIHAAAHIGELNSDHAHQREKLTLPQIRKAFADASSGWNALLEKRADDFGYKLSHRVKLSTDSHYRLSCNFAIAWKLAQLGIPTILLYLGFLDAFELEPDGRLIFNDQAMWEKCVFEKTSKPLPEEIWDASFEVPGGASITVLRRTLTLATHC